MSHDCHLVVICDIQMLQVKCVSFVDNDVFTNYNKVIVKEQGEDQNRSNE